MTKKKPLNTTSQKKHKALTDLEISNASPQEKQYKLFDGGGLYIIIRPEGGKWWRYDYPFLGVEKSISLGTYPKVGLKIARERHEDAVKL